MVQQLDRRAVWIVDIGPRWMVQQMDRCALAPARMHARTPV